MPKCDKSIKILLVGEGGQGVQTLAKILAKAAFEYGYHSSYIPNFGTEQRGGISLAYIQVSCTGIIYPKFQIADVFIVLSSRDIDRTLRHIGQQTHVVYDSTLVTKSAVTKLGARTKHLTPMNSFEMAINKLTERSFNIIILGILTGLVDKNLSSNVLKNMTQKFQHYYDKDPKLAALNKQAFDLGIQMTI